MDPIPGTAPSTMGALGGLYSTPPGGFSGSFGYGGFSGPAFSSQAGSGVGYGYGNPYQLIQPVQNYFGGQMMPNPPPIQPGGPLQGPYSPIPAGGSSAAPGGGGMAISNSYAQQGQVFPPSVPPVPPGGPQANIGTNPVGTNPGGGGGQAFVLSASGNLVAAGSGVANQVANQGPMGATFQQQLTLQQAQLMSNAALQAAQRQMLYVNTSGGLNQSVVVNPNLQAGSPSVTLNPLQNGVPSAAVAQQNLLLVMNQLRASAGFPPAQTLAQAQAQSILVQQALIAQGNAHPLTTQQAQAVAGQQFLLQQSSAAAQNVAASRALGSMGIPLVSPYTNASAQLSAAMTPPVGMTFPIVVPINFSPTIAPTQAQQAAFNANVGFAGLAQSQAAQNATVLIQATIQQRQAAQQASIQAQTVPIQQAIARTQALLQRQQQAQLVLAQSETENEQYGVGPPDFTEQNGTQVLVNVVQQRRMQTQLQNQLLQLQIFNQGYRNQLLQQSQQSNLNIQYQIQQRGGH